MYYQCTTNDLKYFYFVRKIQMRCKEFLVAMCGTAPKIFLKRNSFLYPHYYFWAINTNPDLMARDFLTVEFPFGETIVWLFNSLEEIFRLDGFQINTSIITTVERHTWGASKQARMMMMIASLFVVVGEWLPETRVWGYWYAVPAIEK